MVILDDSAIDYLSKLEAQTGNAASVSMEIIKSLNYYDSTGRRLPGLSDQSWKLVQDVIDGLSARGVSQEKIPTQSNDDLSEQDRDVSRRNFAALWNIYPANRKRDYDLAEKFYLRYCRFQNIDDLMITLRRWVNSGDWAVENGQYIPDISKYFSQKKYWAGTPRYEKPLLTTKKPDTVSPDELAAIAGEENRAIIKYALRILKMPSHALYECNDMIAVIALEMDIDNSKVKTALNEAFNAEIIDKHENKKREKFFSLRNKVWNGLSRVVPKRPRSKPIEPDYEEQFSYKEGPVIAAVDFDVENTDYITAEQLRAFLSVPASFVLPQGFPKPFEDIELTGVSGPMYDMFDVQSWLINQDPKIFEYEPVSGQWYLC